MALARTTLNPSRSKEAEEWESRACFAVAGKPSHSAGIQATAEGRKVKPGFLLPVLGLLPTVALAAGTYVAVPAVGWDALLPYVRANIVADLHGNEFHVFVCQGQTDRTTVTPFDDTLSDFAKVLVTQAMRRDGKVSDGIQAVTEAFRARVLTMSADERARYRELFWQALSAAPEVMSSIRSLFESSRGAGMLRCWLCERDLGFAPLAPRTRGR